MAVLAAESPRPTSQPASPESHKRKQMEDRVHELEGEINRLEDAIAEYEAGLQSFVSAEENSTPYNTNWARREANAKPDGGMGAVGQALQT